MPLVGIALLFYPLFCLCGQHPREQGGAFGSETQWHVGVSWFSLFGLWGKIGATKPSVDRFFSTGSEPSNRGVARLLCWTEQSHQPGELNRQPRDLSAHVSVATCRLTQQSHSLRTLVELGRGWSRLEKVAQCGC